MRRIALGTVGLLALTGAGTGCGPFGGGPDAGDAAKHVAAQLAAGKLTDGAWRDGAQAQQQYDRLVRPLGDLGPTVRVTGTRTDGDSATADLAWSWPVLAGHRWTYTTRVALAKVGDSWRATWTPSVAVDGAEKGDRLRPIRIAPRRGTITGAGGEPLVEPRPVVRFGIDKTEVGGRRALDSARALATLLGVGAAPYVKQVKDAGPKAFVAALTLRAGEVPGAVQRGYRSIPGAVALDDEIPLAPTKEFAAPLLGSVGEATAEIVKDSDGAVHAGDEVGLSGLQRRYDDELRGTPGRRIYLDKAVGAAVRLYEADPVAGRTLRLTLDRRLQSLAEAALADTGPASALVAIRPSTGDLLAAASGPGSRGYNTATFGRYAPGSTFKIVSTLALLRAGLTPTSRVHCAPTVIVNGKRFKNYGDYPPGHLGDITLTAALANSCNTAFVSSHDLLAGDDLGQAAAALGLGVDHDTGFPSYFGQVPRPAGETEAAADLIGQGKVLASPMAMATVVASVVAGRAVVPHLLADDDTSAKPAHPLSAAEAHRLRTMMRAVVTSGSGAGLADVPGPPVIAKTGTAEFGDTPPERADGVAARALPTHVWMVAGQGDLAVAVFVDRGQSGSQTAGPILERFLRDR
jgi:cell division protein FtsI/penicillin-binding protein 2